MKLKYIGPTRASMLSLADNEQLLYDATRPILEQINDRLAEVFGVELCEDVRLDNVYDPAWGIVTYQVRAVAENGGDTVALSRAQLGLELLRSTITGFTFRVNNGVLQIIVQDLQHRFN